MTDLPTCPHCGRIHQISETPKEGPFTCDGCGKEFYLEVEIILNFTSRLICRTCGINPADHGSRCFRCDNAEIDKLLEGE